MANRVWVAGRTGQWNVTSNWTGGVVPVTSDTAIIGSGDAIIDGLTIAGETIVLGGTPAASSVTLSLDDAILKGAPGSPGEIQTSLTVSGGTLSAPLQATVDVSGSTSLDGLVFVGAPRGDLTISAATGSANSFTFDNHDGRAVMVVFQESTLTFTGGTIVNDGIIQLEGGGLHIASGVDFGFSSAAASSSTSSGATPPQGTVLLEDGGNALIGGSVGSNEFFDFVDSTGRVTLQSGAVFSGTFGFGPGALSNTIDVQGLGGVASYNVTSNVLNMLDSGGQVVAQYDVAKINGNFMPLSASLSASDFVLRGDGSGGELITYTPDVPHVLQQSLAVPVVASAGTMVPLSAILDQSFGTADPAFLDLTLFKTTSFTNTPGEVGYWQSPEIFPEWYVGSSLSAATPITSATAVTDIADVWLRVGDQISNPAQFGVEVTSGATPRTSEDVDYSVWSVDPVIEAGLKNWGISGSVPTPAAVQASAYNFAQIFGLIPNNNLCNWIADNVGAGAGATLPPDNSSIDPSLNQPGGFWRIAYAATGPDPVSNWSTLVQPGDIVRMGWFHPEEGIASGHSTTVLGTVTSSGQILFFDNIDNSAGYEAIGVHYDDYWLHSDPADITIYRLDPNGQFLILGTSFAERIQGNVYNDLIQPGGGADTIITGPGNDEIQGTAAELSSITVSDFSLGDYFDFTDLAPGAAAAAYGGGQLLVTSSGAEVATITLAAPPSSQAFIVESDGSSGSFVELLAASSGTLAISSGQVLTGFAVSSGLTLAVSSGGVTVGATLLGGGIETVLLGGMASTTTVLNGGVEQVLAGGVASGGLINLGGRTVVSSGGRTTQDTVFSGGQEIVSSGGVASGATVFAGGTATALKGGVLSGAIVASGGQDIVSSGGAGRGATVSAGGGEIVVNGGIASGTAVLGGGAQTVSSGGTAIGAVVSGGTQIVLARGTASATTVSLGGVEVVSGTTISTVIDSGGTEVVWNGGTASVSVISSGGLERVMANGAMSSAMIAGGELDIQSGGIALSSTITFSGGGSLVLEDNKFRGKIAGFGLPETIDLEAIAYNSATTTLAYAGNSLSGTLTVSDGTNTARLVMLGNYVAGNFTLATDGHGGTLVSDPPVSSGAGIANPH